MSHSPPRHPDFDEGQARCNAFIQSVPQDLKSQEDAIPQRLANLNASPKAKLRQIYKLIDEIGQLRSPYVACRPACSDCCHINVSITALEARQLAEASGRKEQPITRNIIHNKDQFAGQPCPFLVDNLCSVYESRPYPCREHVSFLPTAQACNPDTCYNVTAPLVNFGGLHQARLAIGKESDHVIADIRDFFPPLPG